jgi:hypothetical protein
MPRGFVWGTYVDDLDRAWAMRVDADYADQVERGWEVPPPDGALPFPRGWKPRMVFGVDELGNVRHARVARLDADLWTGGAGAFFFEATDQSVLLATVFELRGERLRPSP